jgi:hypothetical protein
MQITNDDLALIIRPNIADDTWNGTVDLHAVIMPKSKLTDDNRDELMHLVTALSVCFHLLNEDEEFAAHINEEMVAMAEKNDFVMTTGEDVAMDNVVSLTEWTKTRGNA